MKFFERTIFTLAFACLTVVTAIAQSANPDDPAKRSLERIEATMEEKSVVAERAMDAARLIRESAEAKKLGNDDRALTTLAKAEQLAADDELRNNDLIVALLDRIADERKALEKKSRPASTASLNLTTPRLAPRLALTRYRTYRETLGRILIEEKLPPELLAVAMIESGFNPQALSPKGALGIWQLMPATASRYGLKVRTIEDQRTHPELSTRAAARYLRDLYGQFGDWELALAAYNCGEARVQRIIDRTGIRTFAEMSERGLLPLETRQYVPSVVSVWAQLKNKP